MYLCFYFYYDLVYVIVVFVFILLLYILLVCGDLFRVSIVRWDCIEDIFILECYIEEI